MARTPRRSRAESSAPRKRSDAPAKSSGPKHAKVQRSWMARSTLIVTPVILVILTVAAVAFLAPTRTLLDQRRTAAASEQRLAVLDQANSEAQAEADALKTDAEIERIARERYGYAKAGEEVYHLLPEARDPVRVPDAWPFEGLGSSLVR